MCYLKLGRLEEANNVKQEMLRIIDSATLSTFQEYFNMLDKANEQADNERRRRMKGFAQSDGVKKKEQEVEKQTTAVNKSKKNKFVSFLMGSMFTFLGGFALYFVMKNRNKYFK
jgi:hypothetical protein